MPASFKSFLLGLFLCLTTFAHAQWNHIPSGNNYSLAFVKIHEASGTCIAGGTDFLKSTDNGLTWSEITSSTFLSIYGVNAAVIVSPTSYILSDNSNGYYRIWRTTNGGSSWTSYTQSNGMIRDMAYNGSVILAVGDAGLIRKSINNGATWTTVSSPIYTNYKTVEWDAGNNTWVLGGEIRRVTSSSSNPTSFTATTLPYTITDLTYNNGHLVETRKFTNNTQSVVVYDNSGAVLSETPSNSILIKDAFCISANKLVSNNSYYFYEIQPGLNNIYQYIDTIINNSMTAGVEINAMDFCSTYGLAVGPSGGIARYDMNALPDLLLPATFNFDVTAPCAGNPVIATPEYSGGDSFQWYLDGVPVSSNDTLFFNQPANGTTHSVTLELTYGGNTTSYTKQIISTPPPTFPTFGVNVDTTLCYLQQVKFYFTGVTATPAQNFKVRLLRNGVVVSDTMNFHYGINYIPGPVLSEDDTIQLQLFKTISCGTFYQTTDYHFHVGPNLIPIQLVSADSGICQANSQFQFSLANTVPGANYSLNFHTVGASVYHSNFASFIGAGTDTLDFSFNASNFYNMSAYNSGPLIYEYPNNPEYLSFSASYNGCSVSSVPLFDMDLLYTDANFSIRNSSYFPGDTVKFTRVLTCDNFAWDISPAVPVMENLNDSIPVFIPASPGVYIIKETVQSRLGCIDTLTQRLIVADPVASPLDEICYTAKLPAMGLLGSKISSKGNYYDFGYFTQNCCPFRTGFALRKLDANGNLLWDKNNLNTPNPGQISLICAMDIDVNENTYAVIYTNDNFFQFELINHSSQLGGSSFLVKWDSLGNMVQVRELLGAVFSDVVILNDRVLISYFGGIDAFDLDFNLLNSYPHTGTIYNTTGYGSGEDAIDSWNWIPNKMKMEKLANGKVAMVGWTHHYTTTFGSLTLSPSFPCSGAYCSEYVYAAIFDPEVGFINAAIIFEAEDRLLIEDICSDNESNIYLITKNNFSSFETSYFDSIIPYDTHFNKAFLAKVNSDLEPVWLKETSANNGSISCAKESEELVLSGTAFSDFYIGSGTDFKRMAGKNEDLMVYYNSTDYQGLQLHEPFLVKLDLDGNPIYGRMTGGHGSGETPVGHTVHSWNAVSPCGDIYLTHQDRPAYNVPLYTYNSSQNEMEIDGQTYLTDSTLVFKFSSSATCSDECTFFQMNDDDIQGFCNTDTISIPVNFVYGIDSMQYDLLANGSVVESGYMHFSGFNLILPLSGNSTTYSVVLYPTNQAADTIQITGISQPVVPTLQSEYAVPCGDDLQLSVSNSIFSSSAWSHYQGVIDSNFTTTYTLTDFIVGDTVSYSVNTLDQNGCSASTSFNIVYCYNLGLEELNGSDFLLFPNPSSDVVYLVSEKGDISGLTVTIIDIRGNLMASYQAEQAKAGIPVQQLSDGYYFLRIQSQNDVLRTIPFTKE
jgi:photosystem II stability/assembly factor-like uncharacterized protein